MKRKWSQVRGVVSFECGKIRAKLDPNGYALSIGVRLGEKVHLYGIPAEMLGAEPWLTSVGSNV